MLGQLKKSYIFIALLFIYSFFLLMGWVQYETLDDFYMMLLSSGAYTGMPSEFTLFSSVLIGHIYKLLFTYFPLVNWIFIIYYLIHFLCSYIILNIIAKRNNTTSFLIKAVILFFVIIAYTLTKFNFTLIASYAVSTGLIIYHFSIVKSFRVYLLSFLLIILGSLIRKESAYLILMFYTLYVIYDLIIIHKFSFFKKYLTSYFTFILVSFTVIYCFSLIDVFLISPDEMMHAKRWKSVTLLYDGVKFRDFDSNVFSRIGIDVENFSYFKDLCIYELNDPIYQIDNLKKFNKEVYFINNTPSVYLLGFRNIQFLQWMCLNTIIILFVSDKKMWIKYLVILFLFYIGINIFITFIGLTFKTRILYSLNFLFYSFLFIAENKSINLKKNSILLVPIMILFIILRPTNIFTKKEDNLMNVNQLISSKYSSQLGISLNNSILNNMLEVPVKTNTVLFSWLSFHPYNKMVQERTKSKNYLIDDNTFYYYSIKNEDIEQRKYSFNLLKKYLKNKYNKSLYLYRTEIISNDSIFLFKVKK